MTPLIIEFIGLPGAGKTTIVQHMFAELTTAGYQCFSLSSFDNPEPVEKNKGGILSKSKTLVHFLSACLTNPGIARHAFIYAWQVKPRNFENLRRLVVLMARLNYFQTILRKNYDLILLDQGILQYIWSIAVNGKPPEDSRHLQSLLKGVLNTVPSFVVHIDVDVDLAVERIQQRPTARSRFDRMSPMQVSELLTEYNRIFARIINAADYFQDTGFLYINGSQPIHSSVDRIIPFIETQWHGLSLEGSLL